MRINTLFIRCLSAEPVFECFTPSMNGAAWGYTTFSSVFRELWSPRHLNTWIKAIKRLVTGSYGTTTQSHMQICFFCLNFRHVLLQLYMRQVCRSIYFTIFSSLLDVWSVRAGIREKLVTVLYSRQSDWICYFFYFQLNTELCCTAVNHNSVVDGCLSNMHMVLWEIAINASLYRCLNRCQLLKRTDFVTCLHSRRWFACICRFPHGKN